MDDFLDEEEQLGRIPYDQIPISRVASMERKSKNAETSPRVSKFLVYFLVAFFVAFVAITANLYSQINKSRNTYNLDITVQSAGNAVDVKSATTKAIFSAVCVSAGTRESTDLNSFYNQSSRGAGVVLDVNKTTGEAYILTCYHVVQTTGGYYNYVYILPYGTYTPIKMEVVGYSYKYDIALLHVTGSNAVKSSFMTKADIADSANLAPGETCIAIGNPLARGISVSAGYIGNPVNIEATSSNNSMREIKVTAPINAGNSGGGLFNENGDLIGIVNAKLIDEDIDCVGYAIPINLAISLANSINHYGTTPLRADLGLTIQINEDGNSLDENALVVNEINIKNVSSTSYLAGLKAGDIIESFSYKSKGGFGEPEAGETVLVNVKSIYDFEDHMFNLFIDDSLTINVIRGGQKKAITFNIAYVTQA